MARIRGTSQRDFLHGTRGRDHINSGRGNDNVHGAHGNDTINGGPNNDKLYGQSGNDKINGAAGNDLLSGGAGDDQLTGGRGNDKLLGGTGNDTAHFSGNFADYDFTTANGGFRVTHARGTHTDGSDFVATDVESCHFADITVPSGVNAGAAPIAGADVGNVGSHATTAGNVLAN